MIEADLEEIKKFLHDIIVYRHECEEIIATQDFDRNPPPNPTADITNDVTAKIIYLNEHGYLSVGSINRTSEFNVFLAGPFVPTAEGMDWVSENGGITAEKNTVGIRLPIEDLEQLLIKAIEQSHKSKPLKEKLIKQISDLPKKALQQIAAELVKKSWDDCLSHALPLLEKFFGLK